MKKEKINSNKLSSSLNNHPYNEHKVKNFNVSKTLKFIFT